jgi:hypothetical protein
LTRSTAPGLARARALEPRARQEGSGKGLAPTDAGVQKAAPLAGVRADVVRLDILAAVTADDEDGFPAHRIGASGLVVTEGGWLVAGIAEHYIFPLGCSVVAGVARVQLPALGANEHQLVPLVDEVIDGVADGGGESHCVCSSFLCVYYIGGRLGQLTATVRIGEVVAADAAGLNLSRRAVEGVNLSHDGITGGAEGGEVLEKGGGRAGHLGRSWLVMHLL